MKKINADKLLDVQERFYNDPEYKGLWEELQIRGRDFQRTMEELSPRQQATVDDYMGLLHEMQRKLLCYAVEKT